MCDGARRPRQSGCIVSSMSCNVLDSDVYSSRDVLAPLVRVVQTRSARLLYITCQRVAGHHSERGKLNTLAPAPQRPGPRTSPHTDPHACAHSPCTRARTRVLIPTARAHATDNERDVCLIFSPASCQSLSYDDIAVGAWRDCRSIAGCCSWCPSPRSWHRTTSPNLTQSID